jgi:glucose-6-phosphate 1-dehydrogenase
MDKSDTINPAPSIVIFGASGDLTRRKLIPALFSQFRKGRLPKETRIVGSSRSPFSHDEFRERIRQGVDELAQMDYENKEWEEFSRNLWYLKGDVIKAKDYRSLIKFLEELEDGPSNRLYYLATAPNIFPIIIDHLGEMGMATEDSGWRRVIVEKPFGHDLSSAMDLTWKIHSVFKESQVYRIDHYLGKETAQNILYFRFLNSIFEPLWNRNHVDHVQITVMEEVDVGHRAPYYDATGVVRDMFQNHLLQLLTLISMEPPARFEADEVRNEKVKVLRAIRPIAVEASMRAQYKGYCEHEGVKAGSQTPTFAAMKLYIDNWRWQGVPFYLRSGKALSTKKTEIVVEFKAPPHVMFDLHDDYRLTPNFLSICIQPDEGIHLRFETKVPDLPNKTRSVDMEFHYESSFGTTPLPNAYERLLHDALTGDATLFTRNDEIEMAWRLVDSILKEWDEAPNAPHLVSYDVGSWGPDEADEFIAQDGRGWHLACGKHTSGERSY